MTRASTDFAMGMVAMATLAAAVLFVACGQKPDSEMRDVESRNRNSQGEAIFRANCAACHGTNGEGQPNWHIRRPDGVLPAPPLNGDGHTWHHGDGTLYRVVSQGGAIFESPDLPNYKSGMPPFGETLSHDEIVAVINYVKTLWGDKMAEGLGLPVRESQALVSETDPFPEEPP